MHVLCNFIHVLLVETVINTNKSSNDVWESLPGKIQKDIYDYKKRDDHPSELI